MGLFTANKAGTSVWPATPHLQTLSLCYVLAQNLLQLLVSTDSILGFSVTALAFW